MTKPAFIQTIASDYPAGWKPVGDRFMPAVMERDRIYVRVGVFCHSPAETKRFAADAIDQAAHLGLTFRVAFALTGNWAETIERNSFE